LPGPGKELSLEDGEDGRLRHPRRIGTGGQGAKLQRKKKKMDSLFTRVREWLGVTPKSLHATVTGLPVLIIYK